MTHSISTPCTQRQAPSFIENRNQKKSIKERIYSFFDSHFHSTPKPQTVLMVSKSAWDSVPGRVLLARIAEHTKVENSCRFKINRFPDIVEQKEVEFNKGYRFFGDMGFDPLPENNNPKAKAVSCAKQNLTHLLKSKPFRYSDELANSNDLVKKHLENLKDSISQDHKLQTAIEDFYTFNEFYASVIKGSNSKIIDPDIQFFLYSKWQPELSEKMRTHLPVLERAIKRNRDNEIFSMNEEDIKNIFQHAFQFYQTKKQVASHIDQLRDEFFAAVKQSDLQEKSKKLFSVLTKIEGLKKDISTKEDFSPFPVIKSDFLKALGHIESNLRSMLNKLFILALEKKRSSIKNKSLGSLDENDLNQLKILNKFISDFREINPAINDLINLGFCDAFSLTHLELLSRVSQLESYTTEKFETVRKAGMDLIGSKFGKEKKYTEKDLAGFIDDFFALGDEEMRSEWLARTHSLAEGKVSLNQKPGISLLGIERKFSGCVTEADAEAISKEIAKVIKPTPSTEEERQKSLKYNVFERYFAAQDQNKQNPVSRMSKDLLTVPERILFQETCGFFGAKKTSGALEKQAKINQESIETALNGSIHERRRAIKSTATSPFALTPSTLFPLITQQFCRFPLALLVKHINQIV